MSECLLDSHADLTWCVEHNCLVLACVDRYRLQIIQLEGLVIKHATRIDQLDTALRRVLEAWDVWTDEYTSIAEPDNRDVLRHQVELAEPILNTSHHLTATQPKEAA